MQPKKLVLLLLTFLIILTFYAKEEKIKLS